jgi:23S rRNA (guanosine2251-2'-O)-methyltransferase
MREAAPAPELAEDEELIAGRRPVEEAFTAGRPPRRLLVTPQRRQALERIVLHATTLRIPIVEVEGGSLTALAGFDGHQGVAVVVETRRFASVDEIIARSIERSEPAFVLVLDSLEDPQNVGTLLRSAEAAGVHGVVFPTERQAPLSPAAIKASAGATEHLLLAPVDDLAGSLTELHLRGLRIVGSDADAALTAREADLRGPTAIVVGSEGHGLSPAIRRRCDLFVRIPMRGAIGSLNAAVAGSILLFEALGQRDPTARPVHAPAPAIAPARKPASAPAPRRAIKPKRLGTPGAAEVAPSDEAAPSEIQPEIQPEALAPEAASPEPASPDAPALAGASCDAPPSPNPRRAARAKSVAAAPTETPPEAPVEATPAPKPRRAAKPTTEAPLAAKPKRARKRASA